MLISYFALDTMKFWQMMMNRANIVCYLRTHQRICACRKGSNKTNTEEVTAKCENITETLNPAPEQGRLLEVNDGD